ncbi:hypothetical protein TNCV_4728211 [Trichonephila clavipes]|nr:hypothetical protein TNCV_4728211 [Trichonephila clavipes]
MSPQHTKKTPGNEEVVLCLVEENSSTSIRRVKNLPEQHAKGLVIFSELKAALQTIVKGVSWVTEMDRIFKLQDPLKFCSLPQRGEGVFLDGMGQLRRNIFSPGRATLGVKAIPLCPAKNVRWKS